MTRQYTRAIASWRPHCACAVFHALRIQLKPSLYLYSWLGKLPGAKFMTASAGKPPAPSEIADFLDDFRRHRMPRRLHRSVHSQRHCLSSEQREDGTAVREPWRMFLGIKATTMVLDDMRRDLRETRLHVLIIPERVQVREEEWRWLQARFPQIYQNRYRVLQT